MVHLVLVSLAKFFLASYFDVGCVNLEPVTLVSINFMPVFFDAKRLEGVTNGINSVSLSSWSIYDTLLCRTNQTNHAYVYVKITDMKITGAKICQDDYVHPVSSHNALFPSLQFLIRSYTIITHYILLYFPSLKLIMQLLLERIIFSYISPHLSLICSYSHDALFPLVFPIT